MTTDIMLVEVLILLSSELRKLVLWLINFQVAPNFTRCVCCSNGKGLNQEDDLYVEFHHKKKLFSDSLSYYILSLILFPYLILP